MPHSRAFARRRSLTSVINTFLAPRAIQNWAYKIANGARTAHDHILVLHIGAIAGMGAHGRRFYHRSIVETHAFWQLCHAVVIHNEEVLCRAISLESLHTQMLTDIILSTLTRIALAEEQLSQEGQQIGFVLYHGP